MLTGNNQISVCICTYKRPEFLTRLLRDLASQETEGQFGFSIVVVNNDSSRSAEAVVSSFAAASPIPVLYSVEPRQNIALARNRAIENADGEFIAFIDDDEFPTKRWLLTLFQALKEYNVDGVLGPVKPHFDVEPPRWVVKTKLYDRPSYPTGLVIDWKKGRTGNVLLRRAIIDAGDGPAFRPEFRTGEDQDFFRRMIEKGCRFIWCHEALAYEVVPPMRWKRRIILKRALLSGASSVLHPTSAEHRTAKAILAVPAYAAALPFTVFLGQDRLMTCLVKLCDHLGRLLAVLGLHPVREPYVTE